MFQYFYNKRVRKSVAIFGSLFDNIYVIRSAGDNVLSQVKVPLSYGPKRKFIERINEMQNGEEKERQIAIKLPRMSFEMVSITYDPTRQLPKTNSYKRSNASDKTTLKNYYIGVPYILSFQLNVYAKSQDDALQVVEQIIPYFNPQYTVSVKPYDGVDDISEDVPVILSSVAPSDDYEGELSTRRTIIYTLDFDMKVHFYGPAPKDDQGTKVIREIYVDMFNIDSGYLDSDGYLYTKTIVAKPEGVSYDSDYTLGFQYDIFADRDDYTADAGLDAPLSTREPITAARN